MNISLSAPRMSMLLRLADDYLIWFLFGLSVLVMTAVSPSFFSVKNLISIALGSSVLGIMVIAATLPFLIGKFDLSIESTLAFAALIGALIIKAGGWTSAAFVAVLGVGCAIGLVNGLAIVYLGVNPFVQTLAMQIIFRGLIFLITGGIPVYGFPRAYRVLGNTEIVGVPTPIVIVVALYVVFIVLLARTRWGRRLYAVGQNSRAAFSSGISIGRVHLAVFVLAGVLAAFAGLILSSRLDSIDYNVGSGMVFDVFAAAVIGGVSLNGGRGSLVGAIGGVLLLSILSSVLTWLNISIYWVETTRGFIILFAVVVDAMKNTVRERLARR
ncbi:MAG TPA: ABC transporter permease [Methanomassiliicoccales archaeon]|nr:ABC transporter permease [Methanomassiliicoccales archaeon]